MTKRKVYKLEPDYTMRPGVFLRKMLDHAGLSAPMGVRMVAKLAGLEPAVVQGVLDGSTVITPEIAAHLATGTQPLAVSAQFWLDAERMYRDGLKAGKKDVSAEYDENAGTPGGDR